MREVRDGQETIVIGSREEIEAYRARTQAEAEARGYRGSGLKVQATTRIRPDYSEGEYDEQKMKRLHNLLPFLKEKGFKVTLKQGVDCQILVLEGKDKLGRDRKFIGSLHPGRDEVTVNYSALRHIMNIALRGWKV